VTPSISQETGYAWNHGGVAPEINTTWVSFVGPGVRKKGIDRTTWTDETDTRPTILFLTGLQDDYVHDGRVITEGLNRDALPPSMRGPLFEQLAATYKQLNAPVGAYGHSTLNISTAALSSGSTNDDSKYTFLEGALSDITSQRDAVADQIRTALDAAEFQGQPLDPVQSFELLAKSEEIQWQISLLEFFDRF
jgi:hypothetical protein